MLVEWIEILAKRAREKFRDLRNDSYVRTDSVEIDSRCPDAVVEDVTFCDYAAEK